jgi:hypothetical protein
MSLGPIPTPPDSHGRREASQSRRNKRAALMTRNRFWRYKHGFYCWTQEIKIRNLTSQLKTEKEYGDGLLHQLSAAQEELRIYGRSATPSSPEDER